MDFNKNGLSLEEVNKQIKEGHVNRFDEQYTKSRLDIFKDNILTPFNLIVAVIGGSLLAVGAYINMLFIFIIILNISVGIIQELIAKKLVERLSILSLGNCKVIRDGKELEIRTNEIVLNDLIVLEANQQISCDGKILSGELEINEALLTGEIDPILKKEDDEVLSGSYVISGKAYVKVNSVGANNYAAKISAEAKKHQKTHSVLMSSMNKALKLITFFIVPVGLILFIRSMFNDGGTLYDSVVNTSASIISMLPIGVVLLITASLAAGVIKLSRLRVLVQELYALESLSRVNILCLDKTGTLTAGKMEVADINLVNEKYSKEDIDKYMRMIVKAANENNTTFKAMEEHFNDYEDEFKIYAQTNFSSQRKWSSVSFLEDETLYLGAPDILLRGQLTPEINELLYHGERMILLGRANKVNYDSELLDNIEPLALISFHDPLRNGVKQTMGYFKEQGVEIRVISGDNPLTVSKIAKKAGIDNYDKYIDLSTVEDKDLADIVPKYTIFGRTSPKQKKELIKILKKENTVAMTGDGVNDVLALKEADCSIAMSQGSDAARHISQLVLLDSNFNDLPKVVNEGRRVVNNITKVASVYFVKTIYSIILTVLVILLATNYPFTPIQVTLINFAIVGIPTFAITFESNEEPISKNFLQATLTRAIPNAFAIIIMISIVKLLGFGGIITESHQLTMMYFSVAIITYLTVYQISQPLNNFRKGLLIISLITFVILVYAFRTVIELPMLGIEELGIFILIMVLGIYLTKPLLKIADYLVSKIKT